MTPGTPYVRTQIGWTILLAIGVPALVLIPVGLLAGSSVPLLVALGLLIVTAALFGSLTVRVDENYVSWRFGIGLLRKRIDLGNVHAFAAVENPWYWGWGIRWYPGGTLYNVTGRAAVELVLCDQRRIRLGTDDAPALVQALRSRLGESQPIGPVPAAVRRGRRVASAVALFLVLATAAGLPLLMSVQARPAVVTLDPTAIRVENLFYSSTIPINAVQRVELLPRLPQIRLRTNGYALNGTLRGWFLVEQLGQGKLFVEMQHPPFILIRLNQGFVAVNFVDPTLTAELFERLAAQLPEAVR